MGLLGFLKKRSNVDGISDAVVDDGPLLERPRARHYQFAHVGLRKAAYKDPLFFLNVLSSLQRTTFFEQVMETVEAGLVPTDREYTFATNELQTNSLWIDESPCVVIEMPTPRAVSECYYVAAVLLPSKSEAPDVKMDFFTLELSLGPNRERQTKFCAWSRDNAHRNYGPGPQNPTVRGFVDMIENRILK